MPVVVIRSLAGEFAIDCASEALAEALSAGVSRAGQDDIPLRFRLGWRVAAEPGAYRLTDSTGMEAVAGTLEGLVRIVFDRIAALALDAFPEHGRLQAALGWHDGHTFLLIGGPQSGKTTLALALLGAGVEMTGDHLALVGGGQAIAYPGRFGYWETARPLLPGLPDRQVPPILVGGRDRQRRLLIDPIDLGRPWRVRPGPIGWMFCLDPNFHGRSTLRRCSPAEALHYILPNCTPPAIGAPLWMARLYALLDRVQPTILTLGTPDTAVDWVLRALASRTSTETLTA